MERKHLMKQCDTHVINGTWKLQKQIFLSSFFSLFAGHDLPISLLRMLAPPLQLFSAAMWQVVQQGIVSHYGVLEEFVTTVTELVPELMSYRQRAQLILGLRARVRAFMINLSLGVGFGT